MVKMLETKAEFDACLTVNAKVAVDFTADWCGPCRQIGPIFVELAENYPNIKFIKVDVDKNSETAEKCGISAMPTFHFYLNGSKVDELVGASKPKLIEHLEKLNST